VSHTCHSAGFRSANSTCTVRGMHALCIRVGLDMLKGAQFGRFDGDFVKVRSAMLHYACQFECDCSSGPQDCGCGVFSGDISQTFDAVVLHVGYMM
jgi:hypothetical protein